LLPPIVLFTTTLLASFVKNTKFVGIFADWSIFQPEPTPFTVLGNTHTLVAEFV